LDSRQSELVDELVRSHAETAPPKWTKVAFYFEFLEDKEIGLRNKDTGRCFGGPSYDVRLDDFSLGGSMKALRARKALFAESVRIGNPWAGALLVFTNDGRFTIRFFYGQNPLLSNDRDAVNEIIGAGLKDLP